MVITVLRLEGTMDQSVTKRVRMSKDRAARLARLAKRRGMTESAVLREAMDVLERQDAFLKSRNQAIDELIAMIRGPEPKKIQFGLK
jgi:predicted DNA-binding protein